MLCGAEVRVDILQYDHYHKHLAEIQRKVALHIAYSYRMVSESAAMVIVAVIPIDLLAIERQFIYLMRVIVGRLQACLIARTNNI